MLIGEQSATAVAMIVHELATNSMKYGALSTASGKLAVSGHDRAATSRPSRRKQVDHQPGDQTKEAAN